MKNPNPTCEKECRFQYGISTTTCMYFPPVFDKHGNNTNPDGNITSGTVKCSTCGHEWQYRSQYDSTTFERI